MKNYYITYMIFNAINVFLVYKSIHKLLYDNIKNKYLEIGTYIIYYLIISTLYIYSFTPNVIIIANITVLFLILFNYSINMKNRIILLFNLYFILYIINVLVALIVEKIHISTVNIFKYSSIIPFIIENICYVITLRFITLLKIINKVKSLNNIVWLSLVLVPTSSIILNIIFINISNYNLIYYIIFISIIVMINISIYLLYNFIFEAIEKDMKNKILEKENNLYEEQFKNTKKYIDITRKLNHDFKYHLIHTKKLIINKEYKSAISYIDDISKLQENSDKKFIETGNYNIDNIVNFKLNEASNKSININVLANVPYDINISEFYIVSILGNLIQNAIEANEKIEHNRFIDLEIKYKLNKLFITISNRFDKNIEIKNNKLISTKNNKFEHGIGMENIYNFVKKYNGELLYNYKDDIFTVEILLFI
mgnify:CR=1 FL=1